jgi:inner membrane protein
MDNVCHTLAGAAFGRAGLAQRTQLGSATLMIAANLPDLDVLVFATSMPAVAFRRGWTHGVLAQALLPILLALVMAGIGRLRRASSSGPPLSVPWLIALSYVGVISHVLMDLLNNYGVRLLAPLDWRWFYGDAVFIIDPWLWLTLGLGVWLTRGGRGMPRPYRAGAARVALVVALVYIEAMVASSRAARAHVINVWQEQYGAPPPALMVGPVPVTPFTRQVIVDAGNHYETGTFSWFPMRVTFDTAMIPKQDDDPRVTRARAAPNIAAFLVWSRFPFWTLESVQGGTRVSVSDMRFITRGGGFTQSVVVPDLIANPD